MKPLPQPQPLETTCYRFDRSYVWLGAVCTAGFVLFGAGSFVAAYWNLDGSFAEPARSAFFFAAFWLAWTVLGIWLVLAAVRSQLIFTAGGLRQEGCWRARSLLWREVSQARWRVFPGAGSVMLRTPAARMVVELGMFDLQCRLEIIQRIRETVAPGLQENWEAFEKRCLAMPARDTKRLRRWSVLMASLLVAFASLFAVTWALGIGRRHYINLSILNLDAAAWVLWHARKRRMPMP